MNEEKDKALVAACPILYRDRYASMHETCMCWGFDTGIGWDPIIIKLSHKLEAIAMKEPLPVPQTTLQKAGWWFLTTVLAKIPVWRRPSYNKKRFYWETLDMFVPDAFYTYVMPTEDTRLKAVQVKSKYGSLRFYVSGGVEHEAEVSALIREAEMESTATCEECGDPGKLYTGGWWRTLCAPHALEQKYSDDDSTEEN